MFGLVLGSFGFFIFIVLVVRFFIVSPGRVNGTSMEPTYQDNDLFFVKKSTYLMFPPKRFDIIQIVDPVDKQLAIKRIIGMPGETVVIKRGNVYIAEQGLSAEAAVLVDESLYLDSMNQYTVVPGQTAPEVFTLGEYDYFVLGDNRDGSVDSRHYGPVSRTHIVGLVHRSKEYTAK
jgi:signal peptidase I